ncbi:hypothetical protein TCAL_00648 [Tigriopus californicus]|uniref:Mitochondrial import receptor subunit TOM22 homolog n=2 Tax=Tigriopus californicus TaxID=6832 RepID=A0A553PBZ1_TIGCA|nr:hypothetical protein TCAL_00648 [Tigriopus californicus]|eukprot:TCALIF_00648-PA protein Name:"Similar to Tomm22 Mitochondrial import receptor subunit TOM22 homolog (Mus musculus)" AED:0.22 eAED:0.22 QI:0/-1/0/1/-1/1/1/0/211
MSNPSSEVSIEELGPEDENRPADKTPDAEEIVTWDGDQPPPAHLADAEPSSASPAEGQNEGPAGEKAIPVVEEAEPAMPEIVTPAVQRSMLRGELDEDDDDDDEADLDDIEDETIVERLLALSEMFPQSLRNGTYYTAVNSVSTAQWLYSASRSLSWIVFSSAAIMFMPIMIETERMGIEEAQKQQQRQILLGPGAAVSGGGGPPPIPPPM